MTSTPGGRGGTPWWERKEAELREKSSAADDATCSISSSETVRDDRFFFPNRARHPLPKHDISHDLASFRSSFPCRTQYSCRTAPDENGIMRRKCERTVRKFRMCPGR